jgi:predicted DNA-binding transcriptional regulator AlpA
MPKAKSPAVPFNFADLPDEANIRAAPFATLLGVSVPTLDRRVADGTIPAPKRLGSLRVWKVGVAREVLKSLA